MLSHVSVDVVTLSSSQQIRALAQLLWTVTGTLTNVYDNLTTLNFTLDKDITTDIQKHVQIYVQRMHRDQIIDDHTKRFLLQTDPKPGRFYILPKIHKQGNPGRPIVSSNSHPTERISQFVDYHLKPLVQTTQSFIKDTTHNSDNYPTTPFLSL